MRAILLAAGFGSRLRPLTDTIPKCLVPINGKPLLDIWLERLSDAGISAFLINTHYLSERVAAHVASSPYRDRITLVHEQELLGTAGTLLANQNFYGGEELLLLHADNYCLADFRAFIQAHHQRPAECLMTMMTFQTDTPSSCGIVELDSRGVVMKFHEKVAAPPSNLANGAIYLLSQELLQYLVTEMPSVTDFSTEVIHQFLGKIYTYQTDQAFIDIGTPAAYAQANQLDAVSRVASVTVIGSASAF